MSYGLLLGNIIAHYIEKHRSLWLLRVLIFFLDPTLFSNVMLVIIVKILRLLNHICDPVLKNWIWFSNWIAWPNYWMNGVWLISIQTVSNCVCRVLAEHGGSEVNCRDRSRDQASRKRTTAAKFRQRAASSVARSFGSRETRRKSVCAWIDHSSGPLPGKLSCLQGWSRCGAATLFLEVCPPCCCIFIWKSDRLLKQNTLRFWRTESGFKCIS
jgi:hypothetical protein